ncbi:Myo-inositol-1(Or 4)-monophosphatase [Candidatus Terasakiella magnetica]|uniref:Histidinol-phosphatase n=1 Tax=Candidatus Terasakiella magnetica TaxID=1867952 RepID=A0A1C3RC10_9PROT|nr:histidinol-phosphatase [Candidatus Terasakiella magnetica]SCA54800.1 Myo-inositol-1(Or 4)-monophosphatase [Candidatus Terasakiella magnetica]
MTKELIEFAQSLTGLSRDVIRPHFRKNVGIIDKADDSPVTIADRNAEEAMRKAIEAKYPDHGIFGEEHGIKEGAGAEMWVLDPIDGTRSFICGAPWFGTLIAYLENSTPVVGVLDVPMMDEQWVGTPEGTTFNGQACKVRQGVPFEEASLFTTDMDLFEGDQQAAFTRVKEKIKTVRYGTDCYAYALLASGHIDLVIEAGLKPYDAMALVPVIKGAGGIVTGWDGEEVTLDWDGRLLAASTIELHEKALKELRG